MTLKNEMVPYRDALSTRIELSIICRHVPCKQRTKLVMEERPTEERDPVTRGRVLGYQEVFDHIRVTDNSTLVCWVVGIIKTAQPLQNDQTIKALKILARKQEALQMCILPLNPIKINKQSLNLSQWKTRGKLILTLLRLTVKMTVRNTLY